MSSLLLSPSECENRRASFLLIRAYVNKAREPGLRPPGWHLHPGKEKGEKKGNVLLHNFSYHHRVILTHTRTILSTWYAITKFTLLRHLYIKAVYTKGKIDGFFCNEWCPSEFSKLSIRVRSTTASSRYERRIFIIVYIWYQTRFIAKIPICVVSEQHVRRDGLMFRCKRIVVMQCMQFERIVQLQLWEECHVSVDVHRSKIEFIRSANIANITTR